VVNLGYPRLVAGFTALRVLDERKQPEYKR